MLIGGYEDSGAGVTVKKDELLAALRTNRDAHRSLFLDAQTGYREDIIKELDVMLADARNGKKIRRAVSLVEPQDHTSDYDRVIKMLEMCTKDEIFVSEREFSQFVQDDWGWKAEFVGTTSNYSGRAR